MGKSTWNINISYLFYTFLIAFIGLCVTLGMLMCLTSLYRQGMFFMNRFKQSFSRFMYGRYGMDQLSRCLSYVVLVLIILTFFLRSNVIYTVALLGIVYIYFRMFSRNISRRSAENQKYMKIHYKFMSKFNKVRARIKDSKTHRIFKCPSCGQKIRVPKGKGRISIKCPKCRIEFIKKT